MQVNHYQDKDNTSGYLELVKNKYSAQKNFDYFFTDLQNALAFSFSNKKREIFLIELKDGKESMAHIGLIIDSRQKMGEAFWGFFEAPNNKDSFNVLWNELINLAKQKDIKVLKGPVNGSAWHQYRVVKKSDGSPFFKTEMFCEDYYYNFFKSFGPKKEIPYYSAYRTRFDVITSATKPAYEKLHNEGFYVEEAMEVSGDQLNSILELSKQTFKNHWGYIDFSLDDFVSLYSLQKLSHHLSKIYFLKKQEQVVGFLSGLHENESTLILKTICVLPELQGLGLGNMLAYRAHVDAEKLGYKKIIYALIQEDNNIKNFPKDEAIIFRNYATFEFDVKI